MVGFQPITLPGFETANYLYYCVSKLGLNILTGLEARDWNKKYSAKNGVLVKDAPNHSKPLRARFNCHYIGGELGLVL
jgi:hypothetical protein